MYDNVASYLPLPTKLKILVAKTAHERKLTCGKIVATARERRSLLYNIAQWSQIEWPKKQSKKNLGQSMYKFIVQNQIQFHSWYASSCISL